MSMAHHLIPHSGSHVAASSDNNSCAVVALQNAFGFDREGAHDLAASYGRKKNDGMLSNQFKKMVEDFGASLVGLFGDNKSTEYWKLRIPLHKQYSKISIGTFAQQYSKGTYILFVVGHFTVIKDGVLYDGIPVKAGKSVILAWKV
jgi:hypothetical protein